jgi:argininosuccinate synthase
MSMTGCVASLYNEADSSMEASAGLNPVSSQGFAEIQSVEALSLAKAGQIRA